MWRLFRPLRYFALRNREKSQLDLWGTVLIGSLILAPFLLVPDASFFRTGGLLDRLIGLMSALTGFFVAALVAASTFAHPDLDRVMTAGAVQMRAVNDEGAKVWQNMTRRELACAIFGYLSFAAFIFSVAAAIAVPVATAGLHMPQGLPAVVSRFLTAHDQSLRIAVMILFIVPVAHIMTATALGIFYLMERLHYRRPVIVSKQDAA